MPHHRFYCPDLEVGRNVLSSRESHHALASLRIHAGDQVVLFDGKGGEAAGPVVDAAEHRITVEVDEITQHPFDVSHRLTLAVAMPRAHRQAYLIEKCTELGVAAIWPVQTERGVARPGTGAMEKWSQRAIEAAKQSQRRWVPEISAPMSFSDSVTKSKDLGVVALADPDPSNTSIASFLAELPVTCSVLVWIGPEGGLTDAERSGAMAAGAVPIRMAPTILRTETAAVAVCAALALS